jgi:hypothetical protein
MALLPELPPAMRIELECTLKGRSPDVVTCSEKDVPGGTLRPVFCRYTAIGEAVGHASRSNRVRMPSMASAWIRHDSAE